MSDIKEVHGKPRLYVSVNLAIFWSMAAMLRNSVVVVVRTRPRTTPLAMITMRKSFMGFLFFPVMTMGLRLATLRVAGAPLILSTAHYRQFQYFFSFPCFCSKILVSAFRNWSLFNGKWHIALQLINWKSLRKPLLIGRYRILLYRCTVSFGVNLVGFFERLCKLWHQVDSNLLCNGTAMV